MNKLAQLCLLLVILILYLTCSNPANPNVPENATPVISSIDGKTSALIFSDGENVLVQIRLLLSSMMDSVVVAVIDSEGPIDTQFTINKSDLSPTISFKVTLDGPGTKYIKVTSHNIKDITNKDSMKVTVEGTPVQLLGQPQRRIDAAEGERVVLRVTLSGSKPYTGTWYRNGEIIEGAHHDSLVIDPVTVTDTGIYYYHAKNAFSDGENSSECHLYVSKEPTFVLVSDTVVIKEDSTAYIYVLQNDTLPDASYSIGSVSGGTLGTAENHETMIVYIPEKDRHGTDTLTYTVENSDALVFITIEPTQDKPTITSPEKTTVQEGKERRIAIFAEDPDDEPLQLWTDSEHPYIHTTTDNDSIIIRIAPPEGTIESDSLTDSLRIYCTDGIDTTSATLIFTIFKEYRPPVFLTSDTSLTIAEGKQSTAKVRAIDYNGNLLTYSLKTSPSWITSETVSDSLYLHIAPETGTVPNGEEQFIDTVIVEAATRIDTILQKITVTVIQNSSPIFAHPETTVTIDEGEAYSLPISAVDSDGDFITYSASDLPQGATFTDSTFSWTPSFEQAGEYTILIDASDGINTATKTITIIVVNKNRSPVLDSIGNYKPGMDIETAENETLILAVWARDDDGDLLSYAAAGLPNGAHLHDSIFSWVPSFTQQGIYEVTFSVTDGIDTTFQTFRIMVANTNQRPVIDSVGNKEVDANATLTFEITASDPDQDMISYRAQELPAHASFDTVTHVFTWTPGHAQVREEPYIVKFLVFDSEDSASHEVAITVLPVNRSPYFTTKPRASDTANLGSWYSATIAFGDSDGGQTLGFSVVKPGAVTYTRDDNEITFRWFIDNRIYTTGYEDSITVKIFDVIDTIEYTWNIEVKPHIWTVMPGTADKIVYLIGKDSLDIFYMSSIAPTTTTEYSIYRLISGNTWDHFHSKSLYTGGFRKIFTRYNSFFMMGANSQSSYPFVSKVNLSDKNDTSLVINLSSAPMSVGDVNMSGTTVLLYYFSIPEGGPLLRYHSPTENVSIPMDISIKDIQYSSQNIAFGIGDDGIYRMINFLAPATNGNFVQICASVFDSLRLDNNDGDTLYFLKGDSLYRAIGAVLESSIEPEFIRENILNVRMISGNTGWAITSDSTLVFTNDGFGTVSTETGFPGLTESTIKNIVIAEDRKSVFVYNNRQIFRY